MSLAIEATPAITREDIAYHEAAHAVAYIITRLIFTSVAIASEFQSGGRSGYVYHRGITPEMRATMPAKQLLNRAFICLAGPAQDQARNGGFGLGARSDLTVALQYARAAAPTAVDSTYWATFGRAHDFVKHPKQKARIEGVAQALLNHETLTYAQVKALLRKAEAQLGINHLVTE